MSRRVVMPPDLDGPRLYSRAERMSDAVVHLLGLIAALAAVPVLITLTVLWHGNLTGVLGVSVYGICLIAMLTASLAYNHVYHPGWTDRLRRIDLSAIYIKIAGTVTPFVMLSGAGSTFLAAIWTAAVVATATTFLKRRRSTALSVGIALAMGWAVLAGGQEVISTVSWPVLGLMVAGGLLYTFGTPFLLMERVRYHNTIWHAFVVAASVVYFIAVFLHAAQSVIAA
ncbi:PAQR family membrane homeostasis protein TrhA [Jannaschia aquimarina]|uniref:Hemolysin-III related n=1 Tax=Jannaschia aquimarina TaxID=935700 RepID=A0A0D1EH87_9RHOB|nr:hemolysin III family protein [Jannaschia aquimarina]KIT17039.1 hemolysin-III related [Jannaschia aquimarina]SNS82046.1 hemolysin III [Jannaschia aquimarina]